MPKYAVTGGADGQSGVEVDGKRYEPGDTVEIASPKDWRIAAGYLKLASKVKPVSPVKPVHKAGGKA